MSDLVKRLRAEEYSQYYGAVIKEAADCIEQLERELAAAVTGRMLEHQRAKSAEAELAAEKTISDALFKDYPYADEAEANYRKARGAVMGKFTEAVGKYLEKYPQTIKVLEMRDKITALEWDVRLRDEAVERAQAEVERLRAERRMIVSHATMGAVSGEGMKVNAVSHEITKVRNTLYDDRQKKVDTAWNDAIEAAAELCEAQSHTDLNVSEIDYYYALANEHAAENIRALKRGETK